MVSSRLQRAGISLTGLLIVGVLAAVVIGSRVPAAGSGKEVRVAPAQGAFGTAAADAILVTPDLPLPGNMTASAADLALTELSRAELVSRLALNDQAYIRFLTVQGRAPMASFPAPRAVWVIIQPDVPIIIFGPGTPKRDAVAQYCWSFMDPDAAPLGGGCVAWTDPADVPALPAER